jgi:hypothetical protein
MIGHSTIEYIHSSIFPGHGKEKIYFLKMLVDGLGSNVDLLNYMQLGGDLENRWLIFDHVKYVQTWTTIAR